MALSETMTSSTTAANDGVRSLLRAEGLALMTVAVAIYVRTGAAWPDFAIYFLAPDLSMIFYAFGPRIGAAAYNIAHSTIGPLALLVVGVSSAQPMLVGAAAIWLAHIGFDRALGYGLKYASGFRDTHLSRRS